MSRSRAGLPSSSVAAGSRPLPSTARFCAASWLHPSLFALPGVWLAGCATGANSATAPRPEGRRCEIPGAVPISERPAEGDSRSRPGRLPREGRLPLRAGHGLVGQPRKTITVDCGKEFASHAEVAAVLGARVRFALPRRPWRQGGNENTNGLVCDYFPKGTAFARVGDDKVTAACDALVPRAPQVPRVQEDPPEVLCSGVLRLRREFKS